MYSVMISLVENAEPVGTIAPVHVQ